MSFPAPVARFILRPRTKFPQNELLPEGWQDWTGGPFLEPMAVWTAPYELRKLQVVYSRDAGLATATDSAITTHHFLNLTSGIPDATWVDNDFTAVENAFVTFWNAIRGLYRPGTVLDQMRWYKAGPAYHPTPSEGNPAVRIVEQNIAGNDASAGQKALPPQVAVSVTERTALRRRWGRFYLPAPFTGSTSEQGRLTQAHCASIANAAETFYQTCKAADIIPVVFSPTNEAAYSVDEVQVDDLYDVIRSRRWKQPLVRERRVID